MEGSGALAARLAEIASEQWGLLTSGQALRHGATHQQLARLADQGALKRIRHGVYRMAGVPADRLEPIRAAWLACDPRHTLAERMAPGQPTDVVSHRSAAFVYELGDVTTDPVEITSVVPRQSRQKSVRYFHRKPLDPTRWTVEEGLPVTTVPKTLHDLAVAHVDGGHLGGIVRDSLLRGLVSYDIVASEVGSAAQKYGAAPGDGSGLVELLLEQSGSSPEVRLAIAGRIDTSLLPSAGEVPGGGRQNIAELSAKLLAALVEAGVVDPTAGNAEAGRPDVMTGRPVVGDVTIAEVKRRRAGRDGPRRSSEDDVAVLRRAIHALAGRDLAADQVLAEEAARALHRLTRRLRTAETHGTPGARSTVT